MSTSVMTLETPIGQLTLLASGGALEAVHLPGGEDKPAEPARAIAPEDAAALAAARAQLGEYFAGERRCFELPLAARGTPFQRQVWAALTRIPYGETTSYAAIAQAVGRPRAVRAVGAANGKNPLAIVVPCHRVIGADGTLTGYAGGLPIKRWLLDHEAARGQLALL
jgi:methylated-DNA-[protein]-cysteine S-methyltransferase